MGYSHSPREFPLPQITAYPTRHVTPFTFTVRPQRIERSLKMPNSPKDNEEKLRQILNAWKTLASDKSFSGQTVEQFEAFIQPSFTARQDLDDLDDRRTHLLNTRADADEASLAKAAAIVAGVQADPAFGPDSSLFESMGYTRKSERKSGLTRKGGSAPATGGTPPSKP